jgi:four helix bundle protein
MKNNILKDKSYVFAIQIVKASELLILERKEYILSNQLLRSGTAIGALIREAEFGQSKADFINKMSISLKEANETGYWLSLLKDTNYITEVAYLQLYNDCRARIALLVATVKTSKASL